MNPGILTGRRWAGGRQLSVACKPSCLRCFLKLAGQRQRCSQHTGSINPGNALISTNTSRQTNKKNHLNLAGPCASNKISNRQSQPQAGSTILPWEGEGGFSMRTSMDSDLWIEANNCFFSNKDVSWYPYSYKGACNCKRGILYMYMCAYIYIYLFMNATEAY